MRRCSFTSSRWDEIREGGVGVSTLRCGWGLLWRCHGCYCGAYFLEQLREEPRAKLQPPPHPRGPLRSLSLLAHPDRTGKWRCGGGGVGWDGVGWGAPCPIPLVLRRGRGAPWHCVCRWYAKAGLPRLGGAGSQMPGTPRCQRHTSWPSVSTKV